jgi:hypothetical protein
MTTGGKCYKLMKSNINAWDMSLEQFISRFKAIRNQKLTQKTSQFSNLKCIGYDYRIYVNPETLEVINPFTKKVSFQASLPTM